MKANRVLILGGTADGRKLAQSLHQQGLEVIYSVAGLVRQPKVSCTVVSGGFSQFGGLRTYLTQQKITAIVDVTHPFAKLMSTTAVDVAGELGIPCWRFHRPQWQPQAGDDWREFNDWSTLLPALQNYRSIFFSAGQLSSDVLDQLSAQQTSRLQSFLLRTAVEPTSDLPDSMQWIKAIGPFIETDELVLLEKFKIDVLVSKNSGGDATVAKLVAARKLRIPVLMLKRPHLPVADRSFDSLGACEDYLVKHLL